MKRICLVLSLVAASALHAEKFSFDRYQPIIDRQPFGAPPPGFDPTKPASAGATSKEVKLAQQEQEKAQDELKKSVHFHSFQVLPDGTVKVGFTDKSNGKAPRSYWLGLGDSCDGWSLVDANPVSRTGILSKNGIEASFSVGSGDAPADAGEKQKDAANGVPSGGGLPPSRRARRKEKEREQAELVKATQAAQATIEQMRKEAAEREAQREAEREEQRRQLAEVQESLRRSREEEALRKQQEAEVKPPPPPPEEPDAEN